MNLKLHTMACGFYVKKKNETKR